MSNLFELEQHLGRVLTAFGGDLDTAHLTGVMVGWGPERLLEVLRAGEALVRGVQVVTTAAAGVIASKSGREFGHDGIAQKNGFRNAEALIQDITGGSKLEASRQVRVGLSMLDPVEVDASTDVTGDAEIEAAVVAKLARWDAPLVTALTGGVITRTQSDAIRRGLGEPVRDDSGCFEAGAVEAWSVACEQLIVEASQVTAEELVASARTIRDILDPTGADARFAKQFEARSFRMWRDTDGNPRASLRLEEHGYAELRAIFDSALRPRKGGPRFVDPDEKTVADALVADPRSNEQLEYDLLMDLVNTGARADAETVFGVRQAGVRVTQISAGDTFNVDPHTVGVLEDGLGTLPGWLIAQKACNTGIKPCVIDRRGDPLYVGREQRTFTPKQRQALTLRDGGCVWPECDRPASMCEAHHIDPWENHGATDIDRGVLLCRFHHMQLHQNQWHITRAKNRPGEPTLGEFILHPPPGHPNPEPIPLKRRLALRYALGDLHPPRRFAPAA